MNAAIRAVTRAALKHGGIEIVGIRNGWEGLVQAKSMPLDRKAVGGLLIRGGTILGSTPSAVFKQDVELQKLCDGYHELGLDAIIIIGGDSTLAVAAKMSEKGLSVIGIPKTIDNDIAGTERTIGFNTAITVACEAIDRVHTTAESHHRVMIVEVMGRHAGWIAVMAGIAGGADMILIPEKPFDIGKVCNTIEERHKIRDYTIVVVAEGAYSEGGAANFTDQTDAFGYHTLGGVGNWLKREIAEKLGFDTRAIILGHTQRGGTPTVEDRILATRFGVKAVELATENVFGIMVGLREDEIVPVPLKEAVKNRKVDDYWYDIARIFFG